MDKLIYWVEQNPKITLAQLKERFQQLDQPVSFSIETIRKRLDGQLFTLKKVRNEPENANSEINKAKRQAYARRYLELQSERRAVLFLDETNFNLFISRSSGRSVAGTRCTSIAAGSKGRNIHLIGAISNFGWSYFETRRGSFDSVCARDFVERLLLQAKLIYPEGATLVVDNAPCHSQIELVLDNPELDNFEILRLGPYSPMLNPIEHIWSIIKSAVKRMHAENIRDLLRGEDRGQTSCQEYRIQAIEGYIESGLREVNPAKIMSCVAHVQSHLAAAINCEEMIF